MKPKLYGVLNDVQRDHLLAALKERPFLEPLAAKLMSLGGDVPVVWNPDMTNIGTLHPSFTSHGQSVQWTISANALHGTKQVSRQRGTVSYEVAT